MDSSTNDNLELRKVSEGLNEGRKVRVVAKIKSLSDQELDGGSTASWISVTKPDGESSEFVSLSFGDQSASRKETYEVDYCYEPNENTEKIFVREVKPLIPGVFDGHHATIITYGARGTGKTSTIQGTIDKPGLVSLSINELLLRAKEKERSISISYYEVYVDNVYDLLDLKRPTVSVLDNGQGKIQLKGLSKIPLKSLSDFYGLYFVDSNSRKPEKKIANEPPHRSHRGLIVHISSTIESTSFVAKMNFVDMAGYEDARRKSIESSSLVENNKINKSIYALLNVASALNCNDNHVPYRESKLTRILQDSLGGKQSRILMIACLSSSFCQDSIYMANLAARSCQVTKRVAADAVRKIKSSTNDVVHSSLRNQIPKSVFGTVKNQNVYRSSFSEKKPSVSTPSSRMKVSVSTTSSAMKGRSASTTSSTMKGRKMFDDTIRHLGKLDKEIKLSKVSSRRVHMKHGEPTSVVDQENPLLYSLKPGEESTAKLEKEPVAVKIYKAVETTILPEDVLNSNEDPERIGDCIKDLSATRDGQNTNDNDLMSKIDDDHPVESTPVVIGSTSLSVVQNSDLDKENNNYTINRDGQNTNENSLTSKIDDDHPVESTPVVIGSTSLSVVQNLDKENNNYMINEDNSPPISARLRELSNRLRLVCASTPPVRLISNSDAPYGLVSTDVMEPQTPTMERSLQVYDEHGDANPTTPWEKFSQRSAGMKKSLVNDYLRFLNTANKEELKRLKGIGERRATSIIELRAESPEPFKSLDDLMEIGLTAKQIKGLMKQEVGELLFN